MKITLRGIPLLIAAFLISACAIRIVKASWIVTNLHPTGTAQAAASSVFAGRQAGYANSGNVQWRAGHWNGTAASRVDLHPAGASQSYGYGTDSTQQVGQAIVSGVASAALWTGTAGSFVNLHPAGASDSVAYAVTGGQQVGNAGVGGIARASLWSGTAASWVDLNPAGCGRGQSRSPALARYWRWVG